MGNLHVLAFGMPIMGAWFKETVFSARFEANNLVSRGLDVLNYLLMIIAASCEEDVQVAGADLQRWDGAGSDGMGRDRMRSDGIG